MTVCARQKKFALIPAVLMLLAGLLALSGCGNDALEGERVDNLPPKVWLSSAPPEGNETRYRIQLFWGGWDPDGEIAYYEYAITNNETGLFDPADTSGADKWHRVLSNDSTFTFSADELADTNTTDLVTRFERSHTFFIRAVDEQGLASSEPAYRSFTAWTLSPTIRITVPRKAGLTPALVPAITTYQWEATDYVNSIQELLEPDSVRHILVPVDDNDFAGGIDYVRTNPDAPEWSAWDFYRAPQDSGKSWTTPPTNFGSYVFAVQAKDEAGAVTPVFDEDFNIRRVRVSRRSTGPLLRVANEFIGTIRTASPNTPAVIIDMPAGVPLQFRFQADASDYGGIVSGYRYGWDISDLDDPDQWEVDYTPFVRSEEQSQSRRFFFGTHSFNLEVIDNSGATSRIEIKVNIVQFSMNKSLLVVDDFFENPAGSGIVPTRGALPNDAEHDAFWEQVTDNIPGFSLLDDFIQVRGGQTLSIVKFADYKSVVWDAYGGYGLAADARPKLYDLVQFRSKNPSTNTGSGGKIQPNLLALFVKAGGHLLLCGEQPLTQVINVTQYYNNRAARYPFVYKYELEGDQDGNYSDQIQLRSYVGDQSFAYQDMCVNVLDIAYSTLSLIRNSFDNGCGVELTRRPDPRNDGLRAAMPVDTEFNWPTLNLRPEVSGFGMVYNQSSRGLNAELYNPPFFDFCPFSEYGRRPCFEPIYVNICLNTDSPVYQAPVAFWTTTYADIVPDTEDMSGVAARNMVLGVEPFFFNPSEFREMLRIVLFEEWQLPGG